MRDAHEEILGAVKDAEYARAVATYLGLILDRVAARGSNLCVWDITRDNIQNVFVQGQALPIRWDYCEAVSIRNASGGWTGDIDWIARVIENVSAVSGDKVVVSRGSASRLTFGDGYFDAIVTDPPYYDAVPYADLSDFFYVWLRRTIGHLYPEHFRTPLTPKAQEAVQNPVRHNGDNAKAKQFFEDMMARAFRYSWEEGAQRIFWFHFDPGAYTAGGLLSTAEDLAKWAAALDSDQLLSDESLRLMFAGSASAEGESPFGIGKLLFSVCA